MRLQFQISILRLGRLNQQISALLRQSDPDWVRVLRMQKLRLVIQQGIYESLLTAVESTVGRGAHTTELVPHPIRVNGRRLARPVN